MKYRPWKLLIRLIAVMSLMLSALCWCESNWMRSYSNRQDAEAHIAMYDALAIAFICPPIVWFVVDFMKWYGRQRLKTFRRENGLCMSCGYNLTANTSGVCPECGTAVPSKLETVA